MKLAMAQMSMSRDMQKNEEKALAMIDRAAGNDLVLFPEVMLSPFFAQYEKKDVSEYLLEKDSPEIFRLTRAAYRNNLYLSPNLYLSLDGHAYDASLMIDRAGMIEGISTMVHIFQAPFFYEQDYYTPSADGFKVYETEVGRIGIVICFDRHIPESIQTCAARGADLILIPTANTKAEPMDLFEYEIRTQAMQNGVFIAMCNRVGREDQMDFAGESLVASPDGSLIVKAGCQEELVTAEFSLEDARRERQKRPFLFLRRPEMYG